MMMRTMMMMMIMSPDCSSLKDIGFQNVYRHISFLNLPFRKVMIYFCQKGQNMGITDFVLGRTCPEKYPKSGYVS